MSHDRSVLGGETCPGKRVQHGFQSPVTDCVQFNAEPKVSRFPHLKRYKRGGTAMLDVNQRDGGR